MTNKSKFTDLHNYFRSCDERTVTLTFSEIENIITKPLAKSAYHYPAYWYKSTTHTLPDAWLENGYVLKNLDLLNQKATFSRVHESKPFVKSQQPKVELEKQSLITPMQDIDYFINQVRKYSADRNSGSNGRYLSWEHCYHAFVLYRNKHLRVEDIDLLCLHLAFYLASWGMYRGSSFLLQCDYKVHDNAVLEIMKDAPAYDNYFVKAIRKYALPRVHLTQNQSMIWPISILRII